jgi:hypothetical protein
MHNEQFGSCCKDLRDAMASPPISLFRVEDNGVLYLTIGYAQTPQGVAWFDQALLFCPFCGLQIQEREEIRTRSQQDS